MARKQVQFDQRVRKLERKHQAMARGVTAKIRPDGLIVVQPRRARLRLPLMPLLVLVAGVILFKAVLLGAVGPATYGERVDSLRGGSPFEVAGALVMQIDPASAYIGDRIRPYLR